MTEFSPVSVSDLEEAGGLSENDSVVVGQGSTLRRVSWGKFKLFVGSALDSSAATVIANIQSQLDAGRSAYGSWQSLPGNAGKTVAQFLETLRGLKGDKGDAGERGVTGATGPAGPKGDTGATGATGGQGPIGLTGPTGPKGDPGAKGDKGDAGLNGEVTSAQLATAVADAKNRGNHVGSQPMGSVTGLTALADTVAGLPRFGELPMRPWRSGDVMPGGTGLHTKLQAMIDTISGLGGGTLIADPAAVYNFTGQVLIRPNVRILINGATCTFNLAGANDRGFVLMSRAAIEGPGTIHVENTTTAFTGSQVGIHSPIGVGSLYGDGGTVASPNPLEFTRYFAIRNLKLSTNKDKGAGTTNGGCAIGVVGGSNHGLIEGIEVPDNAFMSGGIMVDWSVVGGIVSADSAMSANKALYPASSYTTHPHDIVIRDIKIGILSRAFTGAADSGTFGVRLSGAYNIWVNGVTVAGTTQSAAVFHAGDLGDEFALPADRNMACRNILFENFTVSSVLSGNAAYIDTFADNVYRATLPAYNYSPYAPPRRDGSIVLRNFSAFGDGTSGMAEGILVRQASGVLIENAVIAGFDDGLVIAEGAVNVTVLRGTWRDNRQAGIQVKNSTTPPERILIDGVEAYENGRNASSARRRGINVEESNWVAVRNAVLGPPGRYDASQVLGLVLADSALNSIAEDIYVRSTKSDGYGVYLTSGSGFNVLWRVGDIRANSSFVNVAQAGCECIPIERRRSSNGVRTRFLTSKDVVLTGLLVRLGDVIEFYDSVAGGYSGKRCVAAGIVGSTATLKGFGLLEA